jgi:diguanylate cyclase (GGDEF)-like protein
MTGLTRARTIPLLLLWILMAASLPGQELAVVHYGIREGLPSSVITSLAQTPDGRIWISHSTGVSVYDGKHFRTWTNADGLLDTNPSDLTVDSAGRVILIFPQYGVQAIEPKGTLRTLEDPGQALQADHAAFIYTLSDGSVIAVGKKGYYEVTETEVRGPFYPIPGRSGNITWVLDRPRAGGREILFATSDGVVAVQGQERVILPLPYEMIGSRQIALMAAGTSGETWFFTSPGWMLRQDESGAIQTWNIAEPGQQIAHPYSMQADASGALWIATGTGLVRFFEGKSEIFSDEHGLSNVFAVDVLIDRQGVLWVATDSGLNKISQPGFRNYRYRRGVPVNSIWSLAQLEDGAVWMGTNSGIVEIDPAGRMRIITTQDGLPDSTILDFETVGGGKVWVLGYNGVYLWNGKTFQSYPHELFESLNLYDLFPVSEEEVWIGTNQGVYRLRPQDNQLSPHPLNDLITGSKMVTLISPAANGDIWIVASDLYRWHKQTNTLRKQVFPPELDVRSVLKTVEGPEGQWFLTDRRLILYDGQQWREYPSRGRFFDMVRTDAGEIWIGCAGGVARFDGSRFYFFGLHDGVAIEECNTGASLLDRQGRVWLGGVNLTVVDPKLLRHYAPVQPLLTAARVGMEDHDFPGSLQFLSPSTTVEFHFAAPSFSNEQGLFYRYRVSGFEEWSAASHDTSVRYTYLPAGQHFFEVQASSDPGTWDGPVASLPLTVAPFWWQTAPVWASMAGAVVGLGYLISQLRIRRFKRQQEQLRRLVEEQTAEIKQQRDSLALLAGTDELTGLPNRRRLDERLERELARAKRSRKPMSILLFDLDHFKKVNDSGGHHMGDEMLKAVGTYGAPVIREVDTLARWGGDEFLLLLPETDTTGAMEVSLRLKGALEKPRISDSQGRVFSLSISGGLATADFRTHAATTVEDLVKEADRALYRAKQEGRNRIRIAEFASRG